jgi:hypothetical protein
MRVERGTFGDGPRFEDPVEFEPQIVMQVRCRMLLYNEAEALGVLDLGISTRLRGLREVPFGPILREQFLHHLHLLRNAPATVKVPLGWRVGMAPRA